MQILADAVHISQFRTDLSCFLRQSVDASVSNQELGGWSIHYPCYIYLRRASNVTSPVSKSEKQQQQQKTSQAKTNIVYILNRKSVKTIKNTKKKVCYGFISRHWLDTESRLVKNLHFEETGWKKAQCIFSAPNSNSILFAQCTQVKCFSGYVF